MFLQEIQLQKYAIIENSFEKFVKESARLGFDNLEIGENNIELDIETKKKIVDIILSNNLDFQWKIGKKDPRHQLGIDTILNKIEEAVKIYSKRIVIEANEGINVGIYDEKGLVK